LPSSAIRKESSMVAISWSLARLTTSMSKTPRSTCWRTSAFTLAQVVGILLQKLVGEVGGPP
jgi:hypothetical protein